MIAISTNFFLLKALKEMEMVFVRYNHVKIHVMQCEARRRIK